MSTLSCYWFIVVETEYTLSTLYIRLVYVGCVTLRYVPPIAHLFRPFWFEASCISTSGDDRGIPSLGPHIQLPSSNCFYFGWLCPPLFPSLSWMLSFRLHWGLELASGLLSGTLDFFSFFLSLHSSLFLFSFLAIFSEKKKQQNKNKNKRNQTKPKRNPN